MEQVEAQMWRRILGLVAVASVSAALASPSPAATLSNFRVGNWYAGAYSNDRTNEFDHCAASAKYRNGVLVLFSVGRNYNWSMGFAHPAWRLQPGTTYDIVFTVDQMSPLMGKAKAIRSNLVEVPLKDSTELFRRFRHGYILRVAAAHQIFRFRLTDTSALLPELLACARAGRNMSQMAANPFAPGNAGAPPSVTRDAAVTAEATAFAANLLSLAGLKGFTLLNPGQYPKFQADARWVQGDTIGAVNVLRNLSGAALTNISGTLIAEDAKSCNGAFFSGAIPDSGQGTLARVFTHCERTGKKALTTYYLAVPRKAGGAYVIATIAFGSEKPAKDVDGSLRAAVFKVAGANAISPK